MQWQRTHKKGTKQPVIMHTNAGFWPSQSFMKKWIAYAEECERNSLQPLNCEEYYRQHINPVAGIR